MSAEGLEAARTKMVEAGVQPQAIEVFTHYYHQLEEGVTGLIPEDSIEPLTDPPMLGAVEVSPEQAAEALGRTSDLSIPPQYERGWGKYPLRDGVAAPMPPL